MPSWIIVLFTALFYIFIAQIVTVKNAKYLLAGYNTLSPEEQQAFDIAAYLGFFKQFFRLLALIITALFFLALLFLDEEQAVLFWAIAQMLPFPYLIIKGQRYKKPPTAKG